MKHYRLSFADSIKHVPEHPERTASRPGRGMDMDVYYQVWPNRPAMLRSIDIQERASNSQYNWKACRLALDSSKCK